jgi:ribosome modulation factor
MTRKRTALEGAYRKGLVAALEGASRDACPYRDVRKWDGRLTWSRAFRTAWFDGWAHATNNRADALVTSACGARK